MSSTAPNISLLLEASAASRMSFPSAPKDLKSIMDALQSLSSNVPDWVKRLDELNDQIDKRQQELADAEDTQPPRSSLSLRNRGSTESLKPKDEGSTVPAPTYDGPAPARTTPPQRASHELSAEAKPPSSPNGNRTSPSSMQRRKNEVILTAQRRARATLRKRQRTESMLSGENAAPVLKSRMMIIVYYDSYVQSFFEELVKFVSASRNLIRKAKMAAKVAQIKRLAELEMPDDDDEEDGEDEDELKAGGNGFIAADLRPASSKPRASDPATLMMRYGGIGSRRPGLLSSGLGSSGDPASAAYDELDRGLEFVQSTCERAAHQFLRDGECTPEVERIQKRLGDVKQAAEKELERSSKEDPKGTTESEPLKPARTYRPMSMRRDPGATSTIKSEKTEKTHKIEILDEGVQDMS